jgi:hypothetical protein
VLAQPPEYLGFAFWSVNRFPMGCFLGPDFGRRFDALVNQLKQFEVDLVDSVTQRFQVFFSSHDSIVTKRISRFLGNESR